MSLYDEVLNCPDTHCRKIALDALIAEEKKMSVQGCIYLTFDDLPDMQLTPQQAKELRDALIEIVGLPDDA